MRSIFLLEWALWLLPLSLLSQQTYSLSGTLLDSSRKPLSGATVTLEPGDHWLVSGSSGSFSFTGIRGGAYELKVAHLGYDTYDLNLLIHSDTSLVIKMKSGIVQLEPVTVTADPYAERPRESALSVDRIGGDLLRQRMGGSLVKALDHVPGLNVLEIGSGQAKPMIRGMGFNRLVVLENGIKHEGQQWGADHGLEIDAFSVDQVEILKGPASLMKGSDAIAGVIDLKQAGIPAPGSLEGRLDILANSNNSLAGSSLYLGFRKKSLFFSLRTSGQTYGDFRVPADSVDIYSYRAPLDDGYVRNTAGDEWNLHFSTGYIGKRLNVRMFFSDVNSMNGFFANAHGLEPRRVDAGLHDKSEHDIQFPFHKVRHRKFTGRSEWQFGKFNLTGDFGYQHNYRLEKSQYVSHGFMPAVYPESIGIPEDLEIKFDKTTLTANIRGNYQWTQAQNFVAGITLEHQDNSIGGRAFIIPAFKLTTAGSYMVGNFHLNPNLLLVSGIRIDRGQLHTDAYSDWFTSMLIAEKDTLYEYLSRAASLERIFSSITGSIGIVYTLSNQTFRFNAGKSYRMPIAKELAANGVNYHHFSYEVGDPGLSAEESYQLDLEFNHKNDQIKIEVSPFLNWFPNYIYLNPTPEHDRLYGNGNQVFRYTQSRVLRYGGEVSISYQANHSLILSCSGDYAYSVQLSGEKEGYTLPFSPPPSALIGLRYTWEFNGRLSELSYTTDLGLTAPQKRIVPPEEPTTGYMLIHLGFYGKLRVVNQAMTLSVQVRNLLNRKYFNHTSYYRLVNVPEPGRSLSVTLSLPFHHQIKN